MEKSTKQSDQIKTVIYCGGSKGGCGKSLGAGSIADCLLGSGRQVALVDCDPANADSRLWCGTVDGSASTGSEGVGPLLEFVEAPVIADFGPLVDAICQTKAGTIVVNAGAGDARLFCDEERRQPMLSAAVKEYKWRFVLLYFLTPTYGSIRQVLPLTEACQDWSDIIVLRNLFFPASHFQVWEHLQISKGAPETIKDAVVKLGIREMDWPLLAPPVLLAAHNEKWMNLRYYEKTNAGANHFTAQTYRKGVAKIVDECRI